MPNAFTRLVTGRVAALAAVSAAALVLTAAPARAHEDGVLKLASRALAAGDTIPVAGEKFSRRSELALFLVGVRGRIDLGKVRSDSAGAFTVRLALPADAAEGAYRLVAAAADGDEVATLDVTLAPRSMQGGRGTTAMPEMGEDMHGPTAEPLALDRARSGLVTAGTLGLAVAAFGLGVVLLRRPKVTA